MGSKSEYYEFLGSNTWKDKKRAILGNRGRLCERCGASGVKLHLHHKSYDSGLGNELDDDLMLVCEVCHHELHQDVEFFDNKMAFDFCPECNRKMLNLGNKFICKVCKIEVEPKIKSPKKLR